MIINKIHDNGRLSFLYSTQAIARNNSSYFENRTSKRRKLIIKSNQSIYYLPNDFSGGFRRYRISRFVKEDNSQFNIARIGIKKFQKALHSSLSKNKNLTPGESPINICLDMRERVRLVNDSWKYYLKKGDCLNYSEYDTFSTPIRDKEILMKIKSIRNIDNDYCKIKIGNKNVPLVKVIEKFKKGKISSDPHQNIYTRWGFEEEKKHDCKLYYK